MALISKPNTFTVCTVADAAAVNADFDTIFNDYNGNITDANIANTGVSTYGKVQGSALASLAGVNSGAGVIPALNLASLYPIGIVLTFGVSTNPATLLGFGTWTAIAGKVIVGIDGTTEFATLDQTGGEKTHTITEAEFPTTVGVTVPFRGSDAGGDGSASIRGSANAANSSVSLSLSDVGSGTAMNVLQPYIVKYVWQRTA